jgi:predicted methyltransferase
MRQKKAAGDPVHVGEQSWGVWGPQALTHFLHKTGEHKYAMPIESLFPISFKKRRMMLKPNMDLSHYVTDNTLSIHFWGRRMRMRIIERENGEPHPDSLIGKLIKKHGIVPSDAPLPKSNPHRPKEPKMIPGTSIPEVTNADRQGRGVLNLTDLADARGLDQGSAKHGFTELYQMLLNPLRGRAIHMGLLGLSEPAAVDMWLEYLTKAKLTGIDADAFAGDRNERLKTIRATSDSVETLERAAQNSDPFDVILDDASHASHHQQHAFSALFPKLKSGGLYIVEDLRFQPKALEKSGYPRTAVLFQGYLREGGFAHPNADIQESLNSFREDISGCFIFQAKWHKDKRDQILVVHKR